MIASLLSSVTTLGDDTTFAFPDDSSAVMARSSRRLSRRIPKAIPPPAPEPIAAGRFTAQFPGGAVAVKGLVVAATIGAPGLEAPETSCAPVIPNWVVVPA